MAVRRSNLTLSLYLSFPLRKQFCVCVRRGGWWGGGGCVYLFSANQHWTSQLEKLDQTLPITKLTRDVSFHLSFTGLWNREAEWKIPVATNHCMAGSVWRSPVLPPYCVRACSLYRQDRGSCLNEPDNNVAVCTNISSLDETNPCREQCRETERDTQRVTFENHMGN
jgi:hypothetical protein